MDAQRQRALLDAAPFLVYECEARAPFHCRYLNATAQRLLGWSPRQEPGFRLAQVHPDDLPKVERALRHAAAEGTSRIDYRVLHADGHWLHCQDQLQRDGEGAEAVLLGYSELRESSPSVRHPPWEHILAALDAAVIVAGVDGCIRWINPAFSSMTGYALNEALGRRPDQLLASEAYEQRDVHARMADCVQRGEVFEGEVHNQRKDGSGYWARLRIEPIRRLDGELDGYVAIQWDISGEHAERAQRRELNERLRKLAQNAPGMIYQYQRAPDGSSWFPWSSEGIRAIYGLSPEQVRHSASAVFARVHPQDRPAVEASIEVSARTLQRWQAEYRVRDEHGERWLYGVAMPERLADGGTLWHGAITDISALKQAQQAEHLARAQLQQLIDAATDVSIIATDLDGTIQVFNRGAERLLGYPAEQVIGQVSPGLFHDPQEVAERAAQLSRRLGRPISGFETFVCLVREGGTERRDWTYVRRDGEHLRVSLSVSPVRDADGRLSGFLGIAVDRTGQLMAEQAMRASETKFRNLYESANVAILRNRLDDGQVLEANLALQAITGIAPERYADWREDQWVPDEYQVSLQHQRQLLLQHGRCGPFALQYRRPDGRRVDVLVSRILEREADGTEVAWSVVQDISAHKRTEALALESARALAQNVERTRVILDNTADGIVSIDAQGRIESLNRAAQLLFRVGEAQMIGQSALRLLAIEPGDSVAQELRRRAADSSGSIDVRGRRYDGSEFDLELSLTEVSRQDGPLLVAVLRDVTERKRVEQMKTQFISTVSHELRTPLTSIQGAIGLVAAGSLGALPEPAARLMQVAGRNIQRLGTLINDLLDMEKLLAGELRVASRPCHLGELLQQALELNRGLEAAHRVEFHARIDSDSELQAEVDPDRLQQVLGNLLSNAAKFSPAGAGIELSLNQRGRWARLAVRDHGPGVPAEFQPRLFQKFSQADGSDTRRFGGTGLGLAICRELVQRMGGRIGFEAADGGGAVFWCEFPLLGTLSQSAALRLQEPDPARAAALRQILRGAGLELPSSPPADAQALLIALDLQAQAPSKHPLAAPALQAHAGGGPAPVLISISDDELAATARAADAAADWCPEFLSPQRVLEICRDLLGQHSDRRARVLLALSSALPGRRLDQLGRSHARFETVTSVQDARRRLARNVYDLLVTDLRLSDGSAWDLLNEPRPLPMLVLGLDASGGLRLGSASNRGLDASRRWRSRAATPSEGGSR